MSWLGALAGRAEDLLNKIDSSAANALHNADGVPGPVNKQRPPPPSEFAWEKGQNVKKAVTPTTEEYSPFLSVNKPMTSSTSVPSNLNHMNGDGPADGQMTRSLHAPTKRKDKDEELFEFLNSGDVKVDTTKRKDKTKVNGKRSHGSSGASTPTKTPDGLAIIQSDAVEPNAQDMHKAGG
jgi:hypothetical protein